MNDKEPRLVGLLEFDLVQAGSLGHIGSGLRPLGKTLALCLSLSLACLAEDKPSVDKQIGQLLEAQESLDGVWFRDVIHGVSGKRVLPWSKDDPVAKELAEVIREAAKATLARLNAPDSAARSERRINEVSRLAEDWLREEIGKRPGFACEIPPNAQGKRQRSGYPDMLIRHQASGRVAYLDPKLYEARQAESSLRTFYFQPRRETNKVREDAHHLLLGFAHDGKVGQWRFTSWKLVDLHDLRLQLKAEFHASNRETYREESLIDHGEDR